jgi:hypothetical protein
LAFFYSFFFNSAAVSAFFYKYCNSDRFVIKNGIKCYNF